MELLLQFFDEFKDLNLCPPSMKKGFTLIEMLIVIVVLAIMISMIPFNMQSLQAHTKFALSMNDREDYRQKTVTRMRQSNQYKEAIISMNTTGATVLYIWGIGSGWATTEHLFPQGITHNATWIVTWNIRSYGLSCPGYDTWFQLTLGKNSMCYRVDTNSCNLLKISCKLP